MNKKITYLFLFITLLLSVGYTVYTLINIIDLVNNFNLVINAVILCLFSVFFAIIGIKTTKEKKTIYIPIAALLFITFISFNFLNDIKFLKIQKEGTVDNFINMNVTDVLKWASSNNVEIKQIYEYSDVFPEFYVISQNIKEGTTLNQVNILEVVISKGPNYEKMVIVPNMLGWKLDEVIKFIDNNHLNNAVINFEFSEEEKDIVINQDKNGELRRNEEILFSFSLGNEEDLIPVKLIDFKNKTLFESTLWLKRHGFKFELIFEFDQNIKRNNIIDQNMAVNQLLDPKASNNLILTVSKGQEIIVPDLANMSVEDIINWISNQNLKINFEERYDEVITIGNVIDINYQAGDIIEEGTLINIIISKGQLRMPDLKSLYDFREWGNKYNIEIEEQFEFNSNVKNGDIIIMSHQTGDIISNNDKIIITISQGKPVTIPSFIGITKTQATNQCNLLNIKCSFKMGSYSHNVNKDVVTSQSRNNGAVVIAGSTVTLTLSKGQPQVFDFAISELWYYPLKSADGTINDLRKEFTSRYKDVKFNFVKKSHNTLAPGMIHPDSPTNNGSPNKVEQGKTYTVWIVE